MDPTSFKALQKKWYQKLKKSGFVDIEDETGTYLRQDDKGFFAVPNFDQTTYDTTRRYYELARQLLHTYKFKNPLEKVIWKMHSEGHNNPEIARKVKRSRVWVWKTVARVASALRVE